MAQSDLSAAAALWAELIKTYRSEIPEQSYSTWIKPLKPKKLEDRKLWITAPTKFHREWFEGHYARGFELGLKELCGEEILFKVVVAAPQNNGAVVQRPVALPARPQQPSAANLNVRYRFENFIEGDSNSFARAACLAVADITRPSPWNPLLIYGGTGLGKTHLLQAIGNHVVQRNNGARVLYVSSEKFTQDFIQSVRANRTTDFSHRYRSADLLLVDDIQFFAAKERTQIEFFHSFNSLYQNGKRVVLTSDRPTTELAGFDKRLISRFDSGLVTNIEPPDYETRVAILLKRAESDNFPLSTDIAYLFATHIKANIRELEGAYITLSARCRLSKLPPSMELAREVLLAKTGRPGGRPSVEMIQEAVAEKLNISVAALRGKSRKKEIVYARMIAMTLATELTDHSLKTIGSFFGNRDHSTVIHARDTIQNRIRSDDSEVIDAVNSLKRKLSLSTYPR